MRQFDFSKISYESKWVDYKDESDVIQPADLRLQIRPYPHSSEEMLIEDMDTLVVSEKNTCKKFMYCLTAWAKGYVDAMGKPLPCTDEIKKMMYDFQIKLETTHLIRFVIEKADELRNKKDTSEKN